MQTCQFERPFLWQPSSRRSIFQQQPTTKNLSRESVLPGTRSVTEKCAGRAGCSMFCPCHINSSSCDSGCSFFRVHLDQESGTGTFFDVFCLRSSKQTTRNIYRSNPNAITCAVELNVQYQLTPSLAAMSPMLALEVCISPSAWTTHAFSYPGRPPLDTSGRK